MGRTNTVYFNKDFVADSIENSISEGALSMKIVVKPTIVISEMREGPEPLQDARVATSMLPRHYSALGELPLARRFAWQRLGWSLAQYPQQKLCPRNIWIPHIRQSAI